MTSLLSHCVLVTCYIQIHIHIHYESSAPCAMHTKTDCPCSNMQYASMRELQSGGSDHASKHRHWVSVSVSISSNLVIEEPIHNTHTLGEKAMGSG